MAIGLQELRTTAQRLPKAFESPILPLFAAICGLEALLVVLLPGMTSDVVGSMLGDSLLGVFASTSGVGGVIGVVFALFALDLFRTSLWAPLRGVMLHDERWTLGDVARAARGRMGVLLVTQQIIGVFVFLVGAICFLLGVAIQTFPHVLVTFTLAPALYMVVALKRPIAHSLSTATRVSRRNALAVFGVQGILLAMAYWISEFFQSASVAPLVAVWSALGLLMTYRFASFFGMGTLFIALEEAGEFE